MGFKLLDATSERWRRFNGHELVADVLADVTLRCLLLGDEWLISLARTDAMWELRALDP